MRRLPHRVFFCAGVSPLRSAGRLAHLRAGPMRLRRASTPRSADGPELSILQHLTRQFLRPGASAGRQTAATAGELSIEYQNGTRFSVNSV
jgi:hypothetical protein